jgi:tetratricopeptide (TPR) repeat protein
LAIRRKAFGEYHLNVAYTLNSIAVLLNNQGKYDETLPIFEEALAIDGKTVGEQLERSP